MDKQEILKDIDNVIELTEDFSRVSHLYSKDAAKASVAKLRRAALSLKEHLKLDDANVDIDFGGYHIEDGNIESVQVVGGPENEFARIVVTGKVYHPKWRQGVVEVEPGSMRNVEKTAIGNALAECGGNRNKAAKMLGVSSRTIYRKIIQYGIKNL